MTITMRHSNCEPVFKTIKRFDGIASLMKTVEIAVDKLEELSRPYLIQSALFNKSLGSVEVYLANEADAILFESVFEDFENP